MRFTFRKAARSCPATILQNELQQGRTFRTVTFKNISERLVLQESIKYDSFYQGVHVNTLYVSTESKRSEHPHKHPKWRALQQPLTIVGNLSILKFTGILLKSLKAVYRFTIFRKKLNHGCLKGFSIPLHKACYISGILY